MHSRWLVLTMTLMLLLSLSMLSACGPTEVADPPDNGEEVEEQEEDAEEVDDRYGGELVVAQGADGTYYMPPFTGDGNVYNTKNCIFDSIVRLDKDLVPQPLLAHSWDISEDGLSYTFYLRDDVTWHDGEPFDAYDVYFTYQLIANPLTFSAKRPYLDTVVGYSDLGAVVRELDSQLGKESISEAEHRERAMAAYEEWLELDAIEVVDDYTISFHLSEPQASFITIATEVGVVPRHILEGAEDIMETDYIYKPITTGPFKFVEWVRGDYWILEANEDYFLGRPYLDRIIFRVIPDETTRIHELLAGRVHYIIPPSEDLDMLQDSPGVKVLDGPAVSWDKFDFNLERHFFDDLRVRQAIAHALDKETMVRELYYGWREIAHGPFNPSFAWAHNPDVHVYEYDPDRAMEILREAGFDEESDGWYRNGQSMDFNHRTSTGHAAIERVEVFQRHMRDINVDMTIEPLESAAWLDAIFSSNFDMMYYGWSGLPDPDAYIYTVHHSSAIGGRNVMKYRNDRVDELFDLARVAHDLDERAEYYFEIQEILAVEIPVIYFTYGYSYYGVHEDLEGFVPHPSKHYGIFFSIKDVYWAN